MRCKKSPDPGLIIADKGIDILRDLLTPMELQAEGLDASHVLPGTYALQESEKGCNHQLIDIVQPLYQRFMTIIITPGSEKQACLLVRQRELANARPSAFPPVQLCRILPDDRVSSCTCLIPAEMAYLTS